MSTLVLSIVALIVSSVNLALLVVRNKRMFGRYFPPGPARVAHHKAPETALKSTHSHEQHPHGHGSEG